MNSPQRLSPASSLLTFRLASVGCIVFLIAISLASPSYAQGLPLASPEEIGLDAQRLTRIQEIVSEGISAKKMPGCVVCVGRHGRIGYLESFGDKQVGPNARPMTTDTVFDMASITKPVATATSIMKLVEDGRVRLGEKVITFFPEFAPHGKDQITVRDLLIHQSGLIPDNALSDYDAGAEVAWQRICELDLVAPVGSTFKYSDVNFIVLAEIIRKVTGKNVQEFSQENVFAPLGMSETGYLPNDSLSKRAAPTEKRDGRWMQGEVHDPRAYRLGGIAGHAGLFSTARDLAIYAHMMLGQGTYAVDGHSVPILSARTVATMTRGYKVSSGLRGLGWDKRTGYSSNRGDLLSDAAFGHGGFTGTVLWIDPELDLFFIFLSNRVHPNGKGSVNALAGKIVNVIASSITDDVRKNKAAPVDVLCGIDVLERDGFRQLQSQRVGLISNHTGRNQHGASTVTLLHQSGLLAALFSPEHGFAGELDQSNIRNSDDRETGLTIYSLYGATRRPTAAMLKNVDTLVFDIQDIGTRFYTYISTMGESMIAAAEHDKRFVVLDRPNPINGIDVAGPMLDPGQESFVAFHPLPIRHGMTVGELALMIRDDLKLDLDLEIIECEGWQRGQFWDATGLTWVNPSPNMRSVTQAVLYPGVGLLETTNISVGRGTDTPFEILGAPWIDGRLLAKEMAKHALPGVVFVPVEFQPESSKHAGKLCGGIQIAIVDRARLEPLSVGLHLAVALRTLYPDDWDTSNFNRLLANETVYQAVLDRQPLEDIAEAARQGVPKFVRRREKFLLYDE